MSTDKLKVYPLENGFKNNKTSDIDLMIHSFQHTKKTTLFFN